MTKPILRQEVSFFQGRCQDGSELSDRCDACATEILPLLDKVGIKNDEFFLFRFTKAESASGGHSHSGSKKVLNIPYLYLIKPEEIPEKFRNSTGNILSFEELENRNLLVEFFNWTKEPLGIGDLNIPFDDDARIALCIMLQAWSLPSDQFLKVKQFLFGHELAHIAHDKGGYKNSSLLNWKNFFLGLIITTISAGIGYACTGSVDVHPIVIGLAVSGLAIFYRCRRNAKANQNMEYRADHVSAEISPDSLEGGIIYFRLLRDCEWSLQKGIKSISSFAKEYFAAHPPTFKRLEALEQLSRQARTDHTPLSTYQMPA